MSAGGEGYLLSRSFGKSPPLAGRCRGGWCGVWGNAWVLGGMGWTKRPLGEGVKHCLCRVSGSPMAAQHPPWAPCRDSHSLPPPASCAPLTLVPAEPAGAPGLFHGPQAPPPLLPAWSKGGRAVRWPQVCPCPPEQSQGTSRAAPMPYRRTINATRAAARTAPPAGAPPALTHRSPQCTGWGSKAAAEKLEAGAGGG